MTHSDVLSDPTTVTEATWEKEYGGC